MVSRDRQAEGSDGRNKRRFIARDRRLTVGQAAVAAQVDRETIKYAIRSGRLKAETMAPLRPGGRAWRRVRLSDVLQLFRSREVGR
jgi:hypothetical protein